MNSIESLSTDLSQQQVREEAAVQAEAMALRDAETQNEAMMQALKAAEVITDPARGSLVDLLA
jgi:hypothetical protein